VHVCFERHDVSSLTVEQFEFLVVKFTSGVGSSFRTFVVNGESCGNDETLSFVTCVSSDEDDVGSRVCR
jgi:hypothetical protein